TTYIKHLSDRRSRQRRNRQQAQAERQDAEQAQNSVFHRVSSSVVSLRRKYTRFLIVTDFPLFGSTRFRGRNGYFFGEKSGQHELFQVLPVPDAQGVHGIGKIPFHRIGGQPQVVDDLLVGPSPGRQHGDGELGGGKVVRHMVPRIGVVDLAPTGGKPVGNVNDPLEVLRPFRLDDRFQHTAQQAVMLPQPLDEIVGTGQGPGGQH